MGLQTIGADVKLNNPTKLEAKNFKQYQNKLNSAASISIHDTNNDGKLGDNEYLVIQSKTGECSILYSPKKGMTKYGILQELSKDYQFSKDSIPEKFSFEEFIEIPLTTKQTKTTQVADKTETNKTTKPTQTNKNVKPVEKSPNIESTKETKNMTSIGTSKTTMACHRKGNEKYIQSLLNTKVEDYAFDVSFEGDYAIISYSQIKEGWFTDQPTLGEIKKKLDLKDGVISQYNNLDECFEPKKADDKKTDDKKANDKTNDKKTDDKEPKDLKFKRLRDIRIPINEIIH